MKASGEGLVRVDSLGVRSRAGTTGLPPLQSGCFSQWDARPHLGVKNGLKIL